MKNIHSINDLPELNTANLQEICEMYPFKASEYYLTFIDWEDETDPIRKIIIPSEKEFKGKDGVLDASSEKSYTVLPGCEHKYPDTAVLLISKVCAGY